MENVSNVLLVNTQLVEQPLVLTVKLENGLRLERVSVIFVRMDVIFVPQQILVPHVLLDIKSMTTKAVMNVMKANFPLQLVPNVRIVLLDSGQTNMLQNVKVNFLFY